MIEEQLGRVEGLMHSSRKRVLPFAILPLTILSCAARCKLCRAVRLQFRLQTLFGHVCLHRQADTFDTNHSSASRGGVPHPSDFIAGEVTRNLDG